MNKHTPSPSQEGNWRSPLYQVGNLRSPLERKVLKSPGREPTPDPSEEGNLSSPIQRGNPPHSPLLEATPIFPSWERIEGWVNKHTTLMYKGFQIVCLLQTVS